MLLARLLLLLLTVLLLLLLVSLDPREGRGFNAAPVQRPFVGRVRRFFSGRPAPFKFAPAAVRPLLLLQLLLVLVLR